MTDHTNDTIDKLRKEIDRIDFELIGLLERRNQYAKEIGLLKKLPQMDIKDAVREDQLFARLKNFAVESNLDIEFVLKLWRNILDESYRIQSETIENE